MPIKPRTPPPGYIALNDAAFLAGVSVTSLRKRYGARFVHTDGRSYIALSDLQEYMARPTDKGEPGGDYVNAVQACHALHKSRSWLEYLVKTGKVRKKTHRWKTYYNIADILKLNSNG